MHCGTAARKRRHGAACLTIMKKQTRTSRKTATRIWMRRPMVHMPNCCTPPGTTSVPGCTQADMPAAGACATAGACVGPSVPWSAMAADTGPAAAVGATAAPSATAKVTRSAEAPGSAAASSAAAMQQSSSARDGARGVRGAMAGEGGQSARAGWGGARAQAAGPRKAALRPRGAPMAVLPRCQARVLGGCVRASARKEAASALPYSRFEAYSFWWSNGLNSWPIAKVGAPAPVAAQPLGLCGTAQPGGPEPRLARPRAPLRAAAPRAAFEGQGRRARSGSAVTQARAHTRAARVLPPSVRRASQPRTWRAVPAGRLNPL